MDKGTSQLGLLQLKYKAHTAINHNVIVQGHLFVQHYSTTRHRQKLFTVNIK